MKRLGKIFTIASALLFATSMYFSCSNSAGGDNGGDTDKDSTGGGNKGDDQSSGKIETSEGTISFAGDEITILEASKISETVTSIKITVTNVTGTTTDKTWWFWAKTDGGEGDTIAWISGKDAASIYELTITDATKIAYIKQNGLAIKGSAGLSAKVTVTTTKTDAPNEDGGDDKKEEQPNDDETGEEDSTPSSGAITESGIDYAKLGIEVKASTATFPQDFVRGFDASTVYAIEKAGMEYLDADGKKTDIFQMLKASGVNMIRLRIWNDPSKDTTASKQGNNNLEVTKALAKRVTDAGMEYMLDFHFSDTWADPGNQKCPDAWSKITTVDEMKAAIETFVESTLNTLKEVGLPAMVQLGNECEGGILLINTANTAVQAKAGSANFTAYINAAAAKVRAADKSIKIVMHASRGGDVNVVKNFIENTKGIDCDYIGLSYYPFFTSHSTLKNLKTNIKAITAKGKKAIISETSFCWTCDWVAGKCDNTNNQLYYYNDDNDGLVQAAKSLVDSSGSLVMGLTTTTKDGKIVIAPTVQNQYNAVAAVMEAAAGAGADGVIYWGGDWITNSAGSVPSAMENQAFWDYDHKILDSTAVFSYGTAESDAVGGASTGGGSTGSGTQTISFEGDGVEKTVLEASKISANMASIKITVTGVTGTASGWWFWAKTDGDKGDDIKWKSGEGAEGIYEVTITDATKIQYLRENGLVVKGASGLTATVTVTYE